MALIRALATKSADPHFKNIHSLGFASYVGSVREALVSAEEKAVIITPFIDDQGVNLLDESWKVRANEEVQWEIYVRKTTPSLKRFARLSGSSLFEYPGSVRFGTHAKVLSIDNSRVILGSMNLLGKNMFSNLELGVDIRDDSIVRKISHLEYWFQRSCLPIHV